MITEIVLNAIELEMVEDKIQQLFAHDLYDLLEKKQLRTFRPFNKLHVGGVEYYHDKIFFSAADSL